MNYTKLILYALVITSPTLTQDLTDTKNQNVSNQTVSNRAGLTQANRVIITALRALLADTYVLYTKMLNFHWNVEGRLFSQLHEFFKKLYEDLQETTDLLAERIRALNDYSPASLQEFLSLTQLQEVRGQALPYKDMLKNALADFEKIIKSLRKATELSAENYDWGTNNMLAGILERQEKNAWMIRAHLN